MSEKKEIKLEHYTFDDVVLSMYQLSRDLQLLTKAVAELVQKASNPVHIMPQNPIYTGAAQPPIHTYTIYPQSTCGGNVNYQQNDDGTYRQVKDF